MHKRNVQGVRGYHGWLTINQGTDGENEGDIKSIVKDIDAFFKRSTIENENFHVTGANGLHFIHYSGAHNHNGDTLERIMKMLDFVANRAPGTYGILFFWDDENQEYDNEFQVFKLARGKIEFDKDYYLSPCNPVIED